MADRHTRLVLDGLSPVVADRAFQLSPGGFTVNGAGGSSAVSMPDLTFITPSAPNITPGASGVNNWLDISFAAPTIQGADQIVDYSVRLVTASSPPQYFNTAGTTSYRINNLRAGQLYTIGVASVSRLGYISPYVIFGTFLIPGNTTTPTAIPGSVTVVAAFRAVAVQWSDSTDPDVGGGAGVYLAQISTSNTFASVLASLRVSGLVAVFAGLATGTTYYARVAPINGSGTQGPFNPTTGPYPNATTTLVDGGTDIITGSIIANDIHANTITADRLVLNFGLSVGQNIQSTTFTSGSVGWSIAANGNAEFNAATVRGGVFAGSITCTGTISGPTITGGTITAATLKTSANSASDHIEISGSVNLSTVAWWGRGGQQASIVWTTQGTVTADTFAVNGPANGGASHVMDGAGNNTVSAASGGQLRLLGGDVIVDHNHIRSGHGGYIYLDDSGAADVFFTFDSGTVGPIGPGFPLGVTVGGKRAMATVSWPYGSMWPDSTWTTVYYGAGWQRVNSTSSQFVVSSGASQTFTWNMNQTGA